jgi:two-component system cell cycle response regulator
MSNPNERNPAADLTDVPTEVRRNPTLDATMPPSSAMQAALPGTEDAIMSATPVCDRGTLTMVSGADAGSVYRLGASTAIGRSLDCEIRIFDVGVSRRHAMIEQQGDTDYVVQDLGSRNGTTVRGRPITKCRLVDGDRIGIGPVFFRFALTDEMEELALKRRYESSIIDGLTGALNRKHFDDRLIGELAFAKRHKAEVSLLILDVDHFKEVNDRFGHLAGDSILRKLAATVRDALRVEDVFARYGGEEFAIIARGIERAGALAFAERVRNLVAATTFSYENTPIPLTVSIGVATLTDCRDASVDQLIALADSRLYLAKASGRNCSRGA